HNTITLGNGERDTVYADGHNHDAITLGNGAGDRVDADTDSFGLVSSFDTITLGNGAGDAVDADGSNHDRISLGNGAGETQLLIAIPWDQIGFFGKPGFQLV